MAGARSNFGRRGLEVIAGWIGGREYSHEALFPFPLDAGELCAGDGALQRVQRIFSITLCSC